MNGKTILCLGGGWGGLAAAHALRELLPAEHRVIVVEPRPTFSLCTSYMWLLSGERSTASEARREMAHIARPGIEWLQASVARIDADAHRVETDAGTLTADYLVIAQGAELAPEMIPGLAEHALNLFDADGVIAVREALNAISTGRVVIAVARTPFRCPAAPYEATMVIDWLLRQRGVRDRVEICLYTPEKQPMPVAGAAVGEALQAMLAERDIDYRPQRTISSVDPAMVTFDGEGVPFDMLVMVPPHRAPASVVDSGLIDGTGYVPVHPATLELLSDAESLTTRSPGTYAIGDVTSIRLLNGMLLPKAGVFVESQARVVAANIAAQLEGKQPRGQFDGRGFCYIEVGDGLAAYGDGSFYAYPAPRVELQPPSAAHARAKHEFERVLETWFTS